MGRHYTLRSGNHRRRQASRSLRGGLLILAIAVAGYGAYDYAQKSDATENTIEVNATVTNTAVETFSRRRGSPNYKPGAVFESRYRGESYTADDVYPATFTSTYDTREAVNRPWMRTK